MTHLRNSAGPHRWVRRLHLLEQGAGGSSHDRVHRGLAVITSVNMRRR